LFKSTNFNNRLKALHLNNINNIKGQFKVLEDISTEDKIDINRKKEELYNLLLEVKVNESLLLK